MTDVPAPDITLVTATDNCGTPVVTWMGDVWTGNCPRIITRTYQATEACGNTTTCTQTSRSNDSIAAADHLPGGCDGGMCDGCSGTGYHAVTATDNCGTPVVTLVGDVMDGLTVREIITRTYQAADCLWQYSHVHPDHHGE